MATVLKVNPRFLIGKMSQDYYERLDYIQQKEMEDRKKKVSEESWKRLKRIEREINMNRELYKQAHSEYVKQVTKKKK